MTDGRDAVLADEIRAQPDALERFREREGRRALALGRSLIARDPRGVLVAARGSSDHAAVYAKYLFGARLGLPVALAAPSLVTRYGGLPRLDGWIAIGISQSGISPDIVTVVEAARAQGCLTVGVTDHPGSPLGRAVEEAVELHVGGERSVAATGTFTTTLYALAHLVSGGATDPEASLSLDDVPGSVESTLALEPAFASVAVSLSDVAHAVVLGRGFGFPVALEWALKLKEVAGLWAEPFSAADYRHGPIALAAPDLAALLIDPSGAGRADLEALSCDLARRDVRIVRASDAPDSDLPFAAVPEWLSPIPAVVPGQLLALHLAWERERDPDRPIGLTKVTRTL